MNLELAPEQKTALLKKLVYAPCSHCGGDHERACPRVKSMTFSADGRTIITVEFWPERKWNPWPRAWPWSKGPRNGVIYLSDVLQDGDELPKLSDEEAIMEKLGMNPVLAMLRRMAETEILRQRTEARAL